MTSGKTITDEQHNGEQGQNLVGLLVGEMGHEWHPFKENEAGIDGMIELRDLATGKVDAQMVRCQVKTGESFIQEESKTCFSWTPSKTDLAYWENSNAPVIVVVVRLRTREAWWIALDDAFPDAEARATRKLTFDKVEGRLNAEAHKALWAVALREKERRASAMQMVLAGPYAAVGLAELHEAAEVAAGEDRWEEAARLWQKLALEARAKALDPRLIWPADEEAARAFELAGTRVDAGRIWSRLAAERVEEDDPDASFAITRAVFDGVPPDFDLELTAARADSAEEGVDAIYRLRSLSPAGAAERRSRAAALVDALTFYGYFEEGAKVAESVLGRRLDSREKRRLALDRLDCLGELGEDVAEEWETLLKGLADRGPYVYGAALQRRAVALARHGDLGAAREHFLKSQTVWAAVRGGEEQVAEIEFGIAALNDPAMLGRRRRAGLWQAAALARGDPATPAARSDRLINGGLAFLAEERWPDAIGRLSLAAMIDRRAGNLASLRRAASFLARAYEGADEAAEALRFWLIAGRETPAAEAAIGLDEAALVELCRIDGGPVWQRAASFAALAAGHAKLSDRGVGELAEAIIEAASPPFGLIAPQPSFHARRLLASICSRVPASLASAAAIPLVEDVERDHPNAPDSSNGLVMLQQRGVFDTVPVFVEAILAGRDLPVTIAASLRDAGPSVIAPLTEAALSGNRVALEELAAADVPRGDPRLREACRGVVGAAVSEADDGPESLAVSFVEFANPARFCEPRLQGRFISMLLGVITGDRYDEVSKESALITITIMARDLAAAPARRALRSLLPVAEGRPLESASGSLQSHPNPKRARIRLGRRSSPDAVRARAVEACGRLARRVAPRSRSTERMLEGALRSATPAVVQMALRELVGLPSLLGDLDTGRFLESGDADVRDAAEELTRVRGHVGES